MQTLIYVASPYTANTEAERLSNVYRQMEASEKIVALDATPYLPLLSHYWDARHPHNWEFWMEICKSIIWRCDAIWRLEGESRGADIEVDLAKEIGIPVLYTEQQLEEYLNAS